MNLQVVVRSLYGPYALVRCDARAPLCATRARPSVFGGQQLCDRRDVASVHRVALRVHFGPTQQRDPVFNRAMNAARTGRRWLCSISFAAVAVGSTPIAAQSSAPGAGVRATPRPPPPPRATTIAWSLEATPGPTITMAQRSSFRLWLVARNAGPAVADTQRDSLEWFVNGQPSLQLSMAFGNGGRTRQWEALAPRGTVREAREGAWLVPSAGTFVFTIRMNGREVARQVVTVR